jgi:transposase
MTENMTVLSRPLVAGRKRDGRRRYDPEAKRELVEACLRPGVSVARMALDHGVNANLLRKWIGEHRGAVPSVAAGHPVSLPAFAPVVPVAASGLTGPALGVTLPNGVKLELRDVGPADLPALLACLAGLPCSASSRG